MKTRSTKHGVGASDYTEAEDEFVYTSWSPHEMDRYPPKPTGGDLNEPDKST